jgi:filamentous hemagglutinin family protein
MSKRMPAGSSLDGWMQQIWRSARLRRGLAQTAGALSAFAPALALANPTGGQVVAGSATIGTAGGNGVIVNQNSQRAAINWQQFSIGSNEYVQFNQPNSSSVVLNRVTGNNPSSIFGSIRANGQVFLINPNGILFAPGSTLDVSSLTASTLDISNSHFMAGRYVFAKDPGEPDATVVNQGSISVTPGGYVVLAGDYVENDGVIQAQTGKVLLAAGGGATLTLDTSGGFISYRIDAPTLARLAGVDNAGSIVANGGAVVMTADVANSLTATAVNNSGLITAHSVRQQGGEILLLSQGGGIENSGTLDASATENGAKGGTVLVHGDGHTLLDPTSVIDVSGDGANGGFVELSGHTLGVRGKVTIGKGGKLLIDPATIKIVDGNVNNSHSVGTTSIGTGIINSDLALSGSVALVASHSILFTGTPGDTIHATQTGHLTLEIGTVTGPSCGQGGVCAADGASATISPLNGGNINITGLGINIAGDFTAIANQGAVTTGNVAAGSITLTAGSITTGNLTAASGFVNVQASGAGGFIQVNGNVKANNNEVVLIDRGGSGISVTGNVTAAFSQALLSASNAGGNVHVKAGNVSGQFVNIVAKGQNSTSIHVANVTATHFGVTINASDSSTSGNRAAKITVGNIVAAKNVSITAHGGNQGGAKVTTGGITAYSSTCGSGDCNDGRVDITANHGIIDVTGNILVTASKANPGNVTLSAGNISFAGITAVRGSVNINESSIASHGIHNITQTAGTIKSRFINVDLNASYGGVMTLNNLTASSSKGSAGIDLTARANNGGAARIVVNGSINVSGVGAGATSTFSGFHNAGITSHTPLGEGPRAAFLTMMASGNGGNPHTIKVNGTINVTGHAGHFNSHTFLHSCECGTVVESGIGGLAEVFAQASGSSGNVQLLGATTVKGPDAQIVVNANTIKTGALTATASGHTLALNVNRSSGEAGPHATFASNNSAGRAVVNLQGSSGEAATSIITGNITLSGKGSASAQLVGRTITTGNITVTATAAKGTRRLTGSGNPLRIAEQNWFQPENPGLFGLRMSTGSYTAGRADVFIAGSNGNNSHSRPATAQSIKVGNVSVTGVGAADVNLTGSLIQVGSVSAIAAGGNMQGTFAGSNEGGVFHQTFTFKNAGEAEVQLDAGSGSHTAITVTGGISTKGPTANINLDGHTVKVSKGLAATGLGGQGTVSSSGTGGAGFTRKFKGPGPLTSVTIGGVGGNSATSINVGGTVSVKGPGLVGIAITGAKVTLGGLSASASAAETYTVVDTQDSLNQTFTADSAAIMVFQTLNDKPGGGPATINGDVTIAAPHGNVAMLSQLNVTGQVKITAGGDIGSDPTTILSRIKAISDVTGNGSGSSNSQGTPSAADLQFKLKAAGVSMVAGGSIDLTGATVTTSGVMALKAGADIILSGVTLNTGTLAADAGSTIHNGGAIGTITTKALALVAGKNINLSSTQISVGSGVMAPVASNAALTAMYADPTFAAAVASDPVLLGGLAAAGISPAAPAPNAVFKAGNTLTLGTMSLTGTYLYMQAGSISLLGPVTVPKGAVVQLAPNGFTGTTDAEGTGAAGATLNLNDNGFFNVFPDGITLVLGGAGQSGAVTLGSNGTFNIGSDNLIVDTTGTVTGLGNVISTGQVVSLASLLTSVPPVTAGEIDPTGNTNPGNDKNKQGQDPNLTGVGTGNQPSIGQDTNPSSVCH